MDYLLGQNRLIYQGPNFATGLTITCYMWDPSLVKTGPFSLTESEEGFYWFDFDFNVEGPWIGLFYENGTRSISSVFRVGAITPGVIRYIK